jgi:hypothetical protein
MASGGRLIALGGEEVLDSERDARERLQAIRPEERA